MSSMAGVAEGSGRVETLRAAFRNARTEERALLLPYMMAGLPDATGSVKLFESMADAGADGFEIGIPYSDPLMDGPTVQAAGLAALEAGVTMASSLDIVEAVVGSTDLPALVMTYINPVLSFGIDRFLDRLAAAGACGLIVADLPVDEADDLAAAAAAHDVGLVLFAAPTTTDERLDRVVAHDPLFVYAVARLGVTGESSGEESQLAELSTRIRGVTDLPVVAGVGIANPEMARDAASHADGVIVGSALVQRVLDAPDISRASSSLSTAVAELAAAVRQ